MSEFDRTLRSRFFLTAPRPCPYLSGRSERKLFTHISGAEAKAANDSLSGLGFRRSQTIMYRPACVGCGACVSTRICVGEFAPNRTQRRILNRNVDLTRKVRPPAATDEQYTLFGRYLAERHADGGMNDMAAEDFAAMIEDSPIDTHVVEYRARDAHSPTNKSVVDAPSAQTDPLLAACLTDQLSDGLSLVYSFFDPAAARRSLGRYMILDHINLAASLRLQYVYLGFWVRGSRKMDYKIQFQPSEIMSDHGWVKYQEQ